MFRFRHDGVGRKIVAEVNHDGTTDFIHTANDVLTVGAHQSCARRL